MQARYIALIPAYEPDRRMLATIAALGKSGFDIVIVDDGSGFGYENIFYEAAEKLPGRSGRSPVLLIHDENKGKGAALRTGLDFINNFLVRKGDEERTVIVTVDADGQHLASDAVKIAVAASEIPGTLVLGSRNMSSAGEITPDVIPLRSRIGNAVTRRVFHAATGTTIYDTQTGLRAFTADLIPEMLAVRGDRYEYELNMLMEFTGRGIPIREMGIETVYLDNNSSSHFDTIRDSLRIYREIGRYVMSGRRTATGLITGEGTPEASGHKARKRLAAQAAKFSVSSFCSFLVDYIMYALLLTAGAGLVAANIIARIISASVNFTINRRLVFRSGRSLAGSAASYAALASCILAGNTVVLETLTATLGINEMIAKVMTEIVFFIISWTVQKYVIFYKGEDVSGNEAHDEPDLAGRESRHGAAAPEFVLEYSAVRPRRLRSVHRRERSEA